MLFALMPWLHATRAGHAGEAVQPGRPARLQVRTDLYGDPLPAAGIARLGTLGSGPGVPITSLAFSPDGNNLAAASAGQASRYVFGIRAR